MEPITLTLLALGGLFALTSKSKKSVLAFSNTKPFVSNSLKYPSDLGFKFDCKSIEITNEVKFFNFLKQIINEVIVLPKFSNPSKIDFCDFLEYCYNKILAVINKRLKPNKQLKCSSFSPDKTIDEKLIIVLLKAQITNQYNNIIFNVLDDKAIWTKNHDDSSTYEGIMIDGKLYTRRKFQDDIIKPCFEKLISNYGIDKSKVKDGIFYQTKKYPNPDYETSEISGFDLICISNDIDFTTAGYIIIKDWEKFEVYLRNLVNKIASQVQFQDPYKLNLESFINEYLKRLNSYCSNSFNERTLTSRMTLIVYVLIQYGLNFYLDNKFGIEDSPKREKYFNEYFKPAFDTLKLNPKFDYIDDQEVFETEKHMKENEETNGWVNIKKW